MKSNNRLLAALAAIIAASCIFTACDSDIAYTLEGTWEGNMFQEYYWEGTTYRPSYTQVTFLKDPYTYSSGDGYWVDYFDSWIPWKNTVVTNHIDWTVRNERASADLIPSLSRWTSISSRTISTSSSAITVSATTSSEANWMDQTAHTEGSASITQHLLSTPAAPRRQNQ